MKQHPRRNRVTTMAPLPLDYRLPAGSSTSVSPRVARRLAWRELLDTLMLGPWRRARRERRAAAV